MVGAEVRIKFEKELRIEVKIAPSLALKSSDLFFDILEILLCCCDVTRSRLDILLVYRVYQLCAILGQG